MKKGWMLFILAVLFFCNMSSAQDKFYTKSGRIRFTASTALENVDATNREITCVLDAKTGRVQFSVLMKGFEFQKALMQEHFNENYVESEKFPKALFDGSLAEPGSVNYSKDGEYPATVNGNLTIHGITKQVNIPGTIIIKDGKPELQAKFSLLIADYNISIPGIVRDKISKTVSVIVNCSLQPLKR